MKKAAAVIAAMMFVCDVWAVNLIKIGLDAGGSQKKTGTVNVIGYGSLKAEDTYTPASGVSIGYEYYEKVASGLSAGVGISYELSRALDKSGGTYNFMPIYVLGKLDLKNTPAYFIAHLGYNTINGDSAYKINDFYTLNGGLYYGVGAGLNLDKFVVELVYSANNASATGKGYYYYGSTAYPSTGDGTITNSKINLSFGYKF